MESKVVHDARGVFSGRQYALTPSLWRMTSRVDTYSKKKITFLARVTGQERYCSCWPAHGTGYRSPSCPTGQADSVIAAVGPLEGQEPDPRISSFIAADTRGRGGGTCVAFVTFRLPNTPAYRSPLRLPDRAPSGCPPFGQLWMKLVQVQ